MESRENVRRASRIEAWHDIMTEGGLLELHRQVRDHLDTLIDTNVDAVRERYQSYVSARELSAEEVDDEARFAVPGLATLERRMHVFLRETHGMREACQLRCMSETRTLVQPHLDLFRVSCFLYDETFKVLAALNRHRQPPSVDILQKYLDSTDLVQPHKIVLDNIQTYFDIFRFVTRESRSVDEQFNALDRLIHGRSSYRVPLESGRDIELNHNAETNLELMARAPFAFWGGTVRNSVPISLSGVPVLQRDVEQPLFAPGFVYLVTREHVKVHDPKYRGVEELMRHGGCPVLRVDRKQDGVLTSLGETYLKYLDVLQRGR